MNCKISLKLYFKTISLILIFMFINYLCLGLDNENRFNIIKKLDKNVEVLDKSRIKMNGITHLYPEYVDLNLTQIRPNRIVKLSIDNAIYGLYVSNNRLLVYSNGLWKLIDLKTEKISFLENITSNDSNYTLNLRVELFNSQTLLQCFSIKNRITGVRDLFPTIAIYDLDNVQEIDGVSMIKPNEKVINKQSKMYWVYENMIDLTRLSFSEDAKVIQNKEEYYLYKPRENKILLYNVTNDSISEITDVKEMIDKYLKYNLNGILVPGFSYVYKKEVGKKNDDFGVYEKDDTGKEVKIFENGHYVYWGTDEKTRLVLVKNSRGKDNIILLSDKGKEKRIILYEGEEVRLLCVSADRKQMVISDAGKATILEFDKEIY